MKDQAGVEVFGYSFNVKSEQDSEQIQAIAEFVDSKMKELAANVKVASTSRLAIMVALNIAEDYFRLKSEHGDLNEAIDKKSARLIRLVEECMD